MTLSDWLWLFAVATVIHNTEEAIWLPAWVRRNGGLPRFPSAFVFRFAAVILSLGFLLLAAFSTTTVVGRHLATGLALAMGFNAFVPHLALTLKKRSYMPGTATATCLVLPAAIGIMISARPDGMLHWGIAVAIAFGLLAMLPVLFRLGAALQKRMT